MLELLVLLVAVGVTACSSSVPGAPPPTQCQRTDRTGTYRASLVTESGNCGDLPSTLVSFNAQSGGGPAACTATSDVWSENDCKLEATVHCVTSGATTDAVAVTRQEKQDGSAIDGTYSVAIRLTDGSVCNGTYALSYVRQ